MIGLCDQCDAIVIQGILCHEWGCPNRPLGPKLVLEINSEGEGENNG